MYGLHVVEVGFLESQKFACKKKQTKNFIRNTGTFLEENKGMS
jgi:hypothetical protein